jgi:hypothetical protein
MMRGKVILFIAVIRVWKHLVSNFIVCNCNDTRIQHYAKKYSGSQLCVQSLVHAVQKDTSSRFNTSYVCDNTLNANQNRTD